MTKNCHPLITVLNNHIFKRIRIFFYEKNFFFNLFTFAFFHSISFSCIFSVYSSSSKMATNKNRLWKSILSMLFKIIPFSFIHFWLPNSFTWWWWWHGHDESDVLCSTYIVIIIIISLWWNHYGWLNSILKFKKKFTLYSLTILSCLSIFWKRIKFWHGRKKNWEQNGVSFLSHSATIIISDENWSEIFSVRLQNTKKWMNEWHAYLLSRFGGDRFVIVVVLEKKLKNSWISWIGRIW